MAIFLTIYHLLFTIYRVLFPRVVLDHKPLPEFWQVALLEIEVCSRDDAFAVVGGDPVNNLWRIGPQVSCVLLVEWLAIPPGENPNMSELSVTNKLQVSLKSRTRHRRSRCRRRGGAGVTTGAVGASLTAP